MAVVWQGRPMAAAKMPLQVLPGPSLEPGGRRRGGWPGAGAAVLG